MTEVIKTLIYGVKSSGNQAERGIRETANLQKSKYPRQNEVVNKDIYVDDCLSDADSFEKAEVRFKTKVGSVKRDNIRRI